MIEGLDVEKKLKSYSKKDIIFNDPHFTERLLMRAGTKDDVIKELLNPKRLVHYFTEKGRQGDIIYVLHFKISNTRTLRIPLIFDRGGKKCLYILTYILRYRPWQNMVKRGVK